MTKKRWLQLRSTAPSSWRVLRFCVRGESAECSISGKAADVSSSMSRLPSRTHPVPRPSFKPRTASREGGDVRDKRHRPLTVSVNDAYHLAQQILGIVRSELSWQSWTKCAGMSTLVANRWRELLNAAYDFPLAQHESSSLAALRFKLFTSWQIGTAARAGEGGGGGSEAQRIDQLVFSRGGDGFGR
jgi:hypothetical protein